MFTDGDTDKYNFLRGGPGVGIHVQVGNKASEESGKMCRCICAAIHGQSVFEACGRYVFAMQCNSEQKLCEN